jgi:hypothetical protein
MIANNTHFELFYHEHADIDSLVDSLISLVI